MRHLVYMKCKFCKYLQLLDDKYYWCERINDSPDIDAERDCDCFKRATNHDVVKRMTAKELAKLLEQPPCEKCEFQGVPCRVAECVGGIINWLRKEVKDD